MAVVCEMNLADADLGILGRVDRGERPRREKGPIYFLVYIGCFVGPSEKLWMIERGPTLRRPWANATLDGTRWTWPTMICPASGSERWSRWTEAGQFDEPKRCRGGIRGNLTTRVTLAVEDPSRGSPSPKQRIARAYVDDDQQQHQQDHAAAGGSTIKSAYSGGGVRWCWKKQCAKRNICRRIEEKERHNERIPCAVVVAAVMQFVLQSEEKFTSQRNKKTGLPILEARSTASKHLQSSCPNSIQVYHRTSLLSAYLRSYIRIAVIGTRARQQSAVDTVVDVAGPWKRSKRGLRLERFHGIENPVYPSPG
ncbi:hypothetical protein ASPWEDRAFT_27019 [Aspergillus wentii DTO 134E9]|uniref:Uncharacterized protein n=1 Tax=Aspergillus wentii DTO 134E9 TaxID=1073089 RepID=A0A1L9RRX6_ASPWE|nr:uncharacterized protein ASPWEDRAFT_27019 [Aspergillus wentii DTO 134E9]OJJ37654.1 hypothetical protein ASPWEDRAFT_27019 [Aspergillus wentii DTO 134E9]